MERNLKIIKFIVRLVSVFSLVLTLFGPLEVLAGGMGPGFRALEAVTYDSMRNRLILLGGVTNTGIANDVWALDLTLGAESWQRLNTQGTAPSPRMWHHAIYDAENDRVIMWGGNDGFNFALSDAWSLDLSTDPPRWTQIRPATQGPGRFGAAAIYDSANQQMVIYGGGGTGGAISSQVWALSLTPGSEDWRQLMPEGETRPGARTVPAIYDADNQRMVFYSGFGGSTGFFNTDTWALDLTTEDGAWIRIEHQGLAPLPRVWNTTVYDDVNKRMIIYGGIAFFVLPDKPDAFNLNPGQAAWTQLTPAGDGHPSEPILSSAIFDSVEGRMVVFGRRRAEGGSVAELYALEGTRGQETWRELLMDAADSNDRFPLSVSAQENSLTVHAGKFTVNMHMGD